MSSDGEPVPGREVWIEKYRPQRLDDVHGHEDTIERLRSYVEQDDLPHLLFSGPAGVGKCVTGDTPVLTNHGVERIENVVGDADGFADPDDDLYVPTFGSDGSFEYTEPSDVFGKEAEELIEVETRDGNELTVTPEHRLLVVGADGFEWREAVDLEPGDRIARPLSVPTPTDSETAWLSAMDGERTVVTVSEQFAERYDTQRELRLDRLRRLDAGRKTLRASVETVQYENAVGSRSRPITPVHSLTPELAQFVGLAVAEARIDGGRIKFYNTDDALLDTFERLAGELFGLDPTRGVQKDVPYVRVISRTLTHFLESVFDVFPSQDGGESTGIGSAIVTAPASARESFLRAMYDAEGHVTEHGIVELTQKSEDDIVLLSYLLSSVGIPSRHRTEWKGATNSENAGGEYHTLYVSGARNLRRFRDRVGFTVEPKATRLAENAAKKPNPNHDTVPVQEDVRKLCERLNLNVTEHLTGSLDDDSPGRVAYLQDVESVVAAATERIEAAQRALERIESIQYDLREATGLPAMWIGAREQLEPLDTRKEVADTTGVRTDRLLEYADGRRTPTASRVETILDELDGDATPRLRTDEISRTLEQCIETLGIEYDTVANGTEMRGTGVIALLEHDDQDLRSLPHFETVARRVETLAAEMLSTEVVETVSDLDRLARGELYFDEVTGVGRSDESRRVYDLTVPETRNYVAGTVPTVVHNTTSAVAIAREIYGEEWESFFLELNASDERGIDVVRDRIKSFARSSFAPDHGHTIVFLDEADSLCLPPGTEIVAGYPSSPEVKPIEDVAEDGEPIPSVDFETNEIQSDEGVLVDSGTADFFEMELADGREITASPTHPFFVVGDRGQLVERELRELEPGDEIADFKDEIGVSQCDVCGDWTAGRFCSLDCKNEGHSREMQGAGNPMYDTEWSDERRKKIVQKLSDGRLAGENNPNHGGEFHGTRLWEMDEKTVEQFRAAFSEMRAGVPWDEWVTDADAEAVKEQIGQTMAEWWDSLDDEERERLIEKRVENTDYPVCDITGDDNPMRDPEVAQRISEALQGHEPTGGNVRYSEELGHRVRSDWEHEVATALQDAGIDYEYEPEFELSDTLFRPDFLIGDTVIEVKGVAALWGRIDEVEEFMERYGDEYEFVVVGDEELPHDTHFELEEFDPAAVTDGGRQPVSTVTVERIEYSHRGQAYNISMDGTPNFMLANGVLTHNTDDAQSALRRTMEQFSDNTRFILSCNYSSKIIDPIQSRCAVFRFSPLSDEAITGQIREIADSEGIELTEEGLEALVYAADGDMRRAINNLQGVATTDGPVTEEDVYQITATARPEEIESMVADAIEGDFSRAQATLDRLLTETGIAGGDVIDQLHRSAWEFDLSERETVRLLQRIGDADYRITEGANERVQLEALLASLALGD